MSVAPIMKLLGLVALASAIHGYTEKTPVNRFCATVVAGSYSAEHCLPGVLLDRGYDSASQHASGYDRIASGIRQMVQQTIRKVTRKTKRGLLPESLMTPDSYGYSRDIVKEVPPANQSLPILTQDDVEKNHTFPFHFRSGETMLTYFPEGFENDKSLVYTYILAGKDGTFPDTSGSSPSAFPSQS